VVPHGERATGDSSLHLTQKQFAQQLDALIETHSVVALAGGLPASSPGERPHVIITFDDAYQGAVVAGVEELRKRGLPATIFVTPAFLGGRSFWWDEIAAAHHGVLPPEIRRVALEDFAGRHESVISWARSNGIGVGQVAWHERAATEDQLQSALGHPGITVGSHTWSHPNLAALSAEDTRAELGKSLEWLRARFSRVVPWIAYPYGLRSPATEAEARHAGYDGGLLIDGGWSGEVANRYAVPRLNIPSGVTERGFSLRASGLLSGH
jgi:peptidoglycan/xylan/chitin deacetylase (PgdA/CDA1 family)